MKDLFTKKTFSLIKATMTQDMSVIKTKGDKNKGKVFPIFIAIILMFCIFITVEEFLEIIPAEMRYIGLNIFITGISALTLMEAIYKSGPILFKSKDNDLLLSLPIDRKVVILSRILKLLVFDFLFNSLFLLPCLVAYIYTTPVNITFYITGILMLILNPIIPTIIGSLIGALFERISSHFKKSSFVQIILYILLVGSVYYFSFNMEKIAGNIGNSANKISSILKYINYPITLYTDLINKFDIVKVIILLLINFIPLILFLYIINISYFKIINKEKSSYSNKNKNYVIKSRSSIKAIMMKEYSRFFSLSAYVINTMISQLILLAGTIFLCIKANDLSGLLSIGIEGVTKDNVNSLYFGIIVFCSLLTCITCSSISLEGRSFSLLKTFPVDSMDILKGKILMAISLIIPFNLVSNIIYFIVFKPSLITIILILIISICAPILESIFGILVNLKMPKLEYSNETEVIKQSGSTMVTTLVSMVFAFTLIDVLLESKLEPIMSMLYVDIGFIILILVAYIILKKKGTKLFDSIQV